MENLQGAVLNLLAVILTAIVGIVAQKVTEFLKQKGIVTTLQAKQESVNIAVNAVEQIYKQENGPEKFEKAKKRASKLLDEQGITITESEMQSLIEACVAEFNKNVKDELNQE